MDVRQSPLVRTTSANNLFLNSPAAPILFPLLLSVLPYANTLANGFVYDDFPQLVDNPYVRSFRHLREIFATTVWSFQGAQGITNYYRPLMTLGYLICYQIFGPLPYGFHLAIVVLHAAVVCLLFWVTRQLFRDSLTAILAAGFFALHPVHTESVAWIAGITDVELTFFYLLAFWFFLRIAGPDGGHRLGVHLAMASSFVLALLSKEQALTLPLLATVYEHFYREDRGGTPARVKLSRYVSLWLLAGVYLILRARFLGGLAPVLQRPGLSWIEVLLSAVALIGEYLGKLFWPVHLCAFYVFHKSSSLTDPRVLAGLAGLLGCAGLFLLLWRRARLVSFALLWLLLTLAPVLNARWMAANVFAERYLYLPSVGFCWLIGWAAARLWSTAPTRGLALRRGLAAALCAIAVLYAARTVTRNLDWRSDEILILRTLASSPDANLMRANLGTIYWNRGDWAAAEREWLKAFEVGPNNVVTLNNLGLLRARQKRYPEAIEFLERAMRIRPTYMLAHLNLADVYLDLGRIEEGEKELRTAVRLSPLSTLAHNRLGKFLFDAGRLSEAEEQFRQSVEIDPTAEACDHLGDIYLRWGSMDRAEQAFAQAARLDHFDSHAHFRLAALYAARGRPGDAVREYEAGLQTDPANAEALAALRQLRVQAPLPAPER